MKKEVIEFAGSNLEVVHTKDSKQWYMTVEDVARAYGVDRSTVMWHLNKREDEIREGVEKGVSTTNTLGGSQELRVLYREGVIKLGYFMRGERAKAFRQFATDLIVEVLDRTGNNSPTGFENFIARMDNFIVTTNDKFEVIDNVCRGLRDEVDELRTMLNLLITEDDEKVLRGLIQQLKAKFNCDGRTIVGKVKALCNKNKIYGPADIKMVINLCRNLMGLGVFGLAPEEKDNQTNEV